MIDDPNLPRSVAPRDLLMPLPSGDRVSLQSLFWAAVHIAREERGVPLDIEQNEDEFLAWLKTEFGGPHEFLLWFTLLEGDGQEKLRRTALALDNAH